MRGLFLAASKTNKQRNTFQLAFIKMQMFLRSRWRHPCPVTPAVLQNVWPLLLAQFSRKGTWGSCSPVSGAFSLGLFLLTIKNTAFLFKITHCVRALAKKKLMFVLFIGAESDAGHYNPGAAFQHLAKWFNRKRKEILLSSNWKIRTSWGQNSMTSVKVTCTSLVIYLL